MTRSEERQPSCWTPKYVLIAACLMAASVVAFRGGWSDIWVQATKRADNGYILLAPFVALWLAHLRWIRAASVPPTPSLLGASAAAVALALAWWGTESDTRAAVHLAAVLAFVSPVLALTGWRSVRMFAPSFGALLFMVPVPGELRRWLAGPLQDLATTMTQEVLELLGTDAVREGNSITLAGQPIFVDEACDGMRMVLALLLTFYAFVFAVPLRLRARLAVLAICPVVALVCNVLRLVPTAFAFAYGSSDVASRVHDVAGWAMLPLALGMLVGFLAFLRWLDLEWLPVPRMRFAQA
ncbi:MAG: exosortase/archaeosortase family protein [Phycisphaerales bacterium]